MKTYERYILIIGVIALAVLAGFYIGKSQRLAGELEMSRADIQSAVEIPIVESSDEKVNVQPQKGSAVVPKKIETENTNNSVPTPPPLP